MTEGQRGDAIAEARRNFLAILLANEPKVVVPLVQGLDSEDFATDSERWVFSQVKERMNKGYKYADLLPMADQKQRELLLDLRGRYVTDGTAPVLRDTILHATKMRKAFSAANNAVMAIRRGEDPLDDLMRELSLLYVPRAASQVHTAKEIFAAALERATEMSGNKRRKVLPLGLPVAEAALAIQPGQLVVIGGRTGAGKTAFALNIAWANAFQAGIPMLYLNSEMDGSEIGLRLAAIAGDMRLGRLRVNPWQEDLDRIATIAKEYGSCPSFTTDPLGDMTSADVIGLTQFHVAQGGVEVVVVDYIQRLRDWAQRKDMSQWQTMMEITQALKTLATDHKIIVICLAQLNSYGELAASKGMANDADLVVTLERCADDIRSTDYKGNATYGKVAEEGPPKTKMGQTHLLKVTKGRHIETGLEFALRMEPHNLKFLEAADEPVEEEE